MLNETKILKALNIGLKHSESVLLKHDFSKSRYTNAGRKKRIDIEEDIELIIEAIRDIYKEKERKA